MIDNQLDIFLIKVFINKYIKLKLIAIRNIIDYFYLLKIILNTLCF